MAKYTRYDMNVLLRTDEDGEDGSLERAVKSHITAGSEAEARRITLERAWASRLLVTRFISIKKRTIK